MSEETDSDKHARITAFYNAAYQAWFATRLEAQKSVFTLSSIAFSACAALLISKELAPVARWAFVCAAASFGGAMLASIRVFMRNSDVVKENLAEGPDPIRVGEAEASTRRSYTISMWLTAIGIAAFAIGLASSLF